ncbi:MAG: hypothetical protein R3356_02405 [Eudoraea sp.]|nr:hypothetical protein [Eudoraea sp.]
MRTNRLFGILFILTGFFAIIGGLYTWGEGSIFKQEELSKVLIPWADVIFTGPLSLLCGYGILKSRFWGELIALATAGIYVFGSVLVWIGMVWEGVYPWYLTIPSISGFLIGILYFVYVVYTRQTIRGFAIAR